MSTASKEIGAEEVSWVADHPLTPLSADEIRFVSSIITEDGRAATSMRFISITLKEPPKQLVLAPAADGVPEREAFVVLRAPSERATHEVVVSLTHGKIKSWRQVPGAQPALSPGEFLKCKDAVRDDPRWRSAIRRRGIR